MMEKGGFFSAFEIAIFASFEPVQLKDYNCSYHFGWRLNG